MALVDITAFEDRLGRPMTDTSEIVRATSALEDASTLVLDEGDATWTADTAPDIVKTIVLTVARRVFENPEGASQKSVGDASVSYRPTSRDGAPQTELTTHERRRVRKAAGIALTSMTLSSPYGPYADTAWLEL